MILRLGFVVVSKAGVNVIPSFVGETFFQWKIQCILSFQTFAFTLFGWGWNVCFNIEGASGMNGMHGIWSLGGMRASLTVAATQEKESRRKISHTRTHASFTKPSIWVGWVKEPVVVLFRTSTLCFVGGEYLHGPKVQPRKYHMTVLLINHVSIFCIGLCASDRFHIKYTYMIDWEHSHVVLWPYKSFSLPKSPHLTTFLCSYFGHFCIPFINAECKLSRLCFGLM